MDIRALAKEHNLTINANKAKQEDGKVVAQVEGSEWVLTEFGKDLAPAKKPAKKAPAKKSAKKTSEKAK